jgi:hypothetical protein
MPRLILALLLALVVLGVLFCVLCGPVAYVALRLWQRGDLAAFRPLRGVWIAQVALACALVFAVDSLGLHNPMGCIVAAVCVVSLGGAALYGIWRLLARGGAP